MLAEGRHIARAQEWKLGISKNGTEQIAVLFETREGERIVWYGFFTERTVERTMDSMDYMGWDGVDVGSPMGLGKNEVELVVEHEQNDEGKTFARVRWVNRLGGLSVSEELTGGKLANFKSRMAGLVIQRRQAAGRPTPRAQKPKNSGGDDFGPTNYDDDISFDNDIPF